jgi:hypothetical protein
LTDATHAGAYDVRNYVRRAKELTMKRKAKSLKDVTVVRAVAATAVVVPLAAFLGGMNLGNHNETFLRDA